mgnify:CR=1 FL=1
MAVLLNQSKQKELISNLLVADTFATRAKGLMGKKTMAASDAVFFPRCNWIHTFFMSMPIDVVYVDKKMKVRKLQQNLKPWRWPAPVFRAHSVIEFAAGAINKDNIEVGDTLYVGD